MKKKISDQDKEDWKRFIESDEKLKNKDININKTEAISKIRTIDLHGYTLENANIVISDFIIKCFISVSCLALSVAIYSARAVVCVAFYVEALPCTAWCPKPNQLEEAHF